MRIELVIVVIAIQNLNLCVQSFLNLVSAACSDFNHFLPKKKFSLFKNRIHEKLIQERKDQFNIFLTQLANFYNKTDNITVKIIVEHWLSLDADLTAEQHFDNSNQQKTGKLMKGVQLLSKTVAEKIEVDNSVARGNCR